MNSFTKLIASTSALIASLSFAWIALTLTGTIPYQNVIVYHGIIPRQGVTVYHDGSLELSSGSGGFSIDHSGSIELTR
jgi:hypothetical protein